MSSDEDNSTNKSSSASAKPFASNHYAWASNINATRQELQRLGIDNTPKPISSSSSSSMSSSSLPNSHNQSSSSTPIPVPSNNVASAWNAAGTWEEKNITNKATDLLKDYFTSSACHSIVDNGKYRIRYLRIPKIDQSEIRVVSVRGKNKLGYEFDTIHIDYDVHDITDQSNPVTQGNGTIILNEIADTDSDIFSSFSLSSTTTIVGTKTEFETKIKKHQEHIRTCFRNWSNEVLKHIATPKE